MIEAPLACMGGKIQGLSLGRKGSESVGKTIMGTLELGASLPAWISGLYLWLGQTWLVLDPCSSGLLRG